MPPATTTYPARFKPADFDFPEGYMKSARETKTKWQQKQVATNLADYGNEAYAARDEEERRGAEAERLIREAAHKADKPTITQDEINRRFSREADRASDNYLAEMGQLREYAGESGITGGGEIAGIASNALLRKFAALTTAKGDLMSFKATSDALDRQKAFDRSTVVAAAASRPVSMLGIDFQNQALQTRLGLYGVEQSRQAAKAAAEASKPGVLDYVSAAAPLLGKL